MKICIRSLESHLKVNGTCYQRQYFKGHQKETKF